MSDMILEAIKSFKKLEGATLKIKKSTYEVVEYDYNFGYLLRKISGKKTNSVTPVSVGVLVNAIKSGEAILLSVKEEQND